MNNQLGRLLLTGVCCLVAVSTAPAQPGGPSDDGSDNASHPSHRLLDGDLGDLAGAEDQLARRLHHTSDMQEIQDLVKQVLEDKQSRDALQENFKDLTPAEIENLKKTIQKNPEVLNSPEMHDLLKEVQEVKKNGDLNGLSPKTRDSMAKLLKDAYDKQKSESGPANPMTGGPMSPAPQPIAPPPNTPPPSLTKPSLPKANTPPGGWRHDLLKGLSGLVKDVGGTPEGERLRTEALRDLARLDSHSPGSSSGLTSFLKGVLSPGQANWLSRNGKSSSHFDLGGWSSSGAASALPSFGGSSGGALDAVVWVAALALLVAAGWMAVAVARRQASRARARAWSPGPWPVHPSQVSTRHDLIRAFEHLAYLLLGPSARSFNHRDVAARIPLTPTPLPQGARGEKETPLPQGARGEKQAPRPLGERGRREGGDDRADAANRLARLYEQARYAPPDETLPPHELTAARGDLAALAGAAA